jgi:hypothetical protein
MLAGRVYPQQPKQFQAYVDFQKGVRGGRRAPANKKVILTILLIISYKHKLMKRLICLFICLALALSKTHRVAKKLAQ